MAVGSLTKKYEEKLRDSRIEYRRDVRMDSCTTFSIGGPADIAVYPRDAGQLARAALSARESELPCVVLGNGSNLLVADAGIRGAVIFTQLMRGITKENGVIRAMCGETLNGVALYARGAGLSGLERAYGVPGSVGGAVYMNAGAYGWEVAANCAAVAYADMADNYAIKERSPSDCEFSYRHSIFMQSNDAIISADFKAAPDDPALVAQRMEDYMARRRGKQPLEYPSAGSVFKRLSGHYTAELIDSCGLKGYTIGGAQVSEKHAGFIVNRGGATADDVRRLIEHIQQAVFSAYGLRIEPEIRMLGFEG